MIDGRTVNARASCARGLEFKFKWPAKSYTGLDTHLFVKVPRIGDSQGTFLTTQRYEAILLSVFPKDTTSKLAGLSQH